MIRKLDKADNAKLMEFLSEEPSINLFIIGDIEAFGYETEFQDLWGQFNESSELEAILLRFHNSFIPYAKGEKIDILGFADIMKGYQDKIFLSGKTEIVAKFEGIEGLEIGKKQVTYFAECTSAKHIGDTDQSVKIATLADMDSIIDLRSTIEEFAPNPNARKMLEQAIETGTGRTYYLEVDGMMVASASTAAENSLSAMIVGVCTHKDYRKKGLATAVMQKLFRDVMNEGKILCLFYDNPEAGSIYKRLGFKDIGMWTMYR